MRDRGLTPADLSSETGLHVSSISRHLNGVVVPNSATLRKYASKFKVDYSELEALAGEDPPVSSDTPPLEIGCPKTPLLAPVLICQDLNEALTYKVCSNFIPTGRETSDQFTTARLLRALDEQTISMAFVPSQFGSERRSSTGSICIGHFRTFLRKPGDLVEKRTVFEHDAADPLDIANCRVATYPLYLDGPDKFPLADYNYLDQAWDIAAFDMLVNVRPNQSSLSKLVQFLRELNIAASELNARQLAAMTEVKKAFSTTHDRIFRRGTQFRFEL
jgi:hypothetical protein